MVLYIDGGRVSSSNFRGIAALGAVMFKKYVCKIKAYCNWIKYIKSVELRKDLGSRKHGVNSPMVLLPCG